MDDERYPSKERRYQSLDRNIIPSGESLKMTLERVTPYWMDMIIPQMKQGKRAIIAAHGNSIRALVKHIENLRSEERRVGKECRSWKKRYRKKGRSVNSTESFERAKIGEPMSEE